MNKTEDESHDTFGLVFETIVLVVKLLVQLWSHMSKLMFLHPPHVPVSEGTQGRFHLGTATECDESNLQRISEGTQGRLNLGTECDESNLLLQRISEGTQGRLNLGTECDESNLQRISEGTRQDRLNLGTECDESSTQPTKNFSACSPMTGALSALPRR